MNPRRNTRGGARIDEIACAVAVLLALAGALGSASGIGWTPWTVVVTATLLAAGLAALVIAVWHRRHRMPRPHVVPLAVFPTVAVLTIGTALITWHQLTAHQVDEQRRQVGQRAADICALLTTVSPDTRADYASRLEPVSVSGMPALATAEILDHVPADVTQTGTVRAVGVREVTDDHAEVIVVIERSPQPAGDNDEIDMYSELVLAMSLVHDEGQWKLAAIAPVIA